MFSLFTGTIFGAQRPRFRHTIGVICSRGDILRNIIQHAIVVLTVFDIGVVLSRGFLHLSWRICFWSYTMFRLNNLKFVLKLLNGSIIRMWQKVFFGSLHKYVSGGLFCVMIWIMGLWFDGLVLFGRLLWELVFFFWPSGLIIGGFLRVFGLLALLLKTVLYFLLKEQIFK